MARPRGSRGVRGWIMTPDIAAAAGVPLTGELSKEDGDKLVKAKMDVKQATTKAKKQKTSEQKAKQKQRITAQARKRIGALNDKQSELYDQVLQVRDAISQGKQLVETKRTAKKKFNANPEAGGLMTRDVEYKVSRQKATKAQLQKMYDLENELEGKMMKLESRKNQILKATQKLYR